LRGRKLPERQRYGRAHREVRRRFVPLVASGAAVCSRCGDPIVPGEPWDLDHSDNGDGYRGVSHADCNRAAANTRPVDYSDRSRWRFSEVTGGWSRVSREW
jgi:hypothetical protein